MVRANTATCDRALVAVCFLALGAVAGCSSTASSEPAQPGCRSGYDGCLGITISNSDPAPYQTSATSDGKGTLYVALLKQCPSLQEQQLGFASEIVSIPNADLTGAQTYSPTLFYRFVDDRFGTAYQAGDHVALGGFLDDDLSVTVPTAPSPNPGDTILSCADVELARGQNVLVRPVVPCLILAAPPLLFQQTGFANPCLND